uniref:LIM zinc-binding domain-containing protein n=1 Tax=Wuchereria bancrofti TaxID=6293 RepID=A0A1I8ENJ4_WUCBA
MIVFGTRIRTNFIDNIKYMMMNCFADVCFKCNTILMGSNLKVFGKCWFLKCYACSTCDTMLNQKSKVIEWDM